jgi:ribosomal protein S18 acetylase RimI-like enzyme
MYISAVRELLAGRKKKDATDASTIEIRYNNQVPINDVLEVLYPLFGQYYPYNEFISMIYSINHVLCAYDKTTGQPIACALLNNDKTPGSVYIMLFGVRQSNQRHGTGTYLLEKVIQWARKKGYRFMHLHVHIYNVKAIGLYEKVGFQKYQYLQNFYGKLPKYPPHAYEMILYIW